MDSSGFPEMIRIFKFHFKMKLHSLKYVLIFILIICSGNLFPQGKVLSEGEELNYIVSYGFINLGEVRFVLSGKDIKEGKEIYSSRSTMKSYKGIPFVSLNSIFESDMVYENNHLYTIRFKATEYKEEGIFKVEYIFHYDSNYVHVNIVNNGKTERDENIRINQNVKFQDGLSLFYCSRLNSFSEENFLVPVFMNESETSVNYYFSTQKENTSISAFDDDIMSIRCNGVANFKGVFGLTGEFAGWFSDDEARIPLRSQLNVLIGNVTLELDSYKRKNWIR